MSFLVPCERCRRHVLDSEATCPFCAAEVTATMRAFRPRVHRPGLGRAALIAVSATVASGAPACGGESREEVFTTPIYGAPIVTTESTADPAPTVEPEPVSIEPEPVSAEPEPVLGEPEPVGEALDAGGAMPDSGATDAGSTDAGVVEPEPISEPVAQIPPYGIPPLAPDEP